MTDHKIVCWGDYAIPVPLWAKWLAMDKDKTWHVYNDRPVLRLSLGEWDIPSFCEDYQHSCVTCFCVEPEQGDWHEKLYWIGDDDE